MGDQSNLLEKAKEAAAKAAVDEFIKDGQVVGIGSGSTIEYAIKKINEKVVKEKLNLICIPSSYQALRSLYSYKDLNLGSLDRTPHIDVAIDGADEVDKDFNLIKGGGGCLVQEKIIISNADKIIIIADYRKDVENFGKNFDFIPIEVIPMAQRPVKEKITKIFGGKCELREAKKKAGPIVTDNNNFILDWYFDKLPKIYDWNQVHQRIINIPGVVDTGLFLGMCHKVFFGKADGSSYSREPKL